MTLPVRTLPIVEQWSCHGCGICCKMHTIHLDDEDYARLKEQRWDEHPEFRGQAVVKTLGWLGRERVLAQRADGSCVFLTEQGRCRIHEIHGEPEKPWACRMFPFTFVPAEDHLTLTMRRSCPSAADEKGATLQSHEPYVRQFLPKVVPENAKPLAPRVVAGAARSWKDARVVARAFASILADPNLPLVRRMLVAARLANDLQECKREALTGAPLEELVEVLRDGAEAEAGQWFADRQPPRRLGAVVFRQVAAMYARCHPNLGDRPGLWERARLFWAALKIARGRGAIPRIHPELPAATFADLERPLGPLSHDVLFPLVRFFEATALSGQYCGAGRRGWPILDGMRGLILAYPISLWLLRWLAVGRQPTRDDAVQAVCMLDRSHYYDLLTGPRHRSLLRQLAQLGEFERLIAWYAR